MDFQSASDPSNQEAQRLERVRSDIQRRLARVISDWPIGDQSELVEKIAQSEERYPSEAILERIRRRLSPGS
jgi:hypothetical protein